MSELSIKSHKNALHNAIPHPFATAFGALTLSVALAASAQAAKPATPQERQPALTAPLKIDPATIVKDRLVRKQTVTFDAFQGVSWGPNGDNITTVPLTAQVDGHTDYFSVTQTQPNQHGSLRTLRVSELVDLAPNPLVPELFAGIASPDTTTQSGVVTLTTGDKAPFVHVPGVAYGNGAPLFSIVGQTTPNPNAIQSPVAQA